MRVLLGVGLATVAGVASASAFVPNRSDDAVTEASAVVAPDGTAPRVLAATRDPEDGPDWAVRVYHSTAGQTCPEAGRVLDGRFGRYDDEGFTELPVAPSGSCADLARSPAAVAVNRYTPRAGNGGRTAIFGAASPDVRSVELATPTGAAVLDLDDGAFLAVRRGIDLSGLVLTLVTIGGERTSYVLTPPAEGSPNPG